MPIQVFDTHTKEWADYVDDWYLIWSPYRPKKRLEYGILYYIEVDPVAFAYGSKDKVSKIVGVPVSIEDKQQRNPHINIQLVGIDASIGLKLPSAEFALPLSWLSESGALYRMVEIEDLPLYVTLNTTDAYEALLKGEPVEKSPRSGGRN